MNETMTLDSPSMGHSTPGMLQSLRKGVYDMTRATSLTLTRRHRNFLGSLRHIKLSGSRAVATLFYSTLLHRTPIHNFKGPSNIHWGTTKECSIALRRTHKTLRQTHSPHCVSESNPSNQKQKQKRIGTRRESNACLSHP
jgi:hypothetical protein